MFRTAGVSHYPFMEEIAVREVVETVKEFGVASLELVACELSLSHASVTPTWSQAVERRLIRQIGHCKESGERLFAVTPVGAI